jgi:hypothetical protein
MKAQRREVCIWVRRDALIVANDGRPVTRLGVRALVHLISPKKANMRMNGPTIYPVFAMMTFLMQ